MQGRYRNLRSKDMRAISLISARPVRSIQRDRTLSALIPVLVTGIQPGQVIGLERLFCAADAALLSSL